MTPLPLVKPSSLLIEQTAVKFATEFYEIGRSQGLKSKHKTHKAYAQHNWYRFIPKAVEMLIDMLNLPHVPKEQKDLIMEALMERKDFKPYEQSSLPEIDIKKLIPTKPLPPVIINTTKPPLNIDAQPLPMKGI